MNEIDRVISKKNTIIIKGYLSWPKTSRTVCSIEVNRKR